VVQWAGCGSGVAREIVETPDVARGLACVAGSGVGTLLGPEGTTWLFRRWVVFLGTVGARSPLVRGGGCWSVWSLRIVQWTRASFVSVHICVVIS
jgi:hypothetical protein